MGFIKCYVKRRLELGRLNFSQRQMFLLGNIALGNVMNRISLAQGPADTPAKPLKKPYAIRKTKYGLGNKRNLYYTGRMKRAVSVRSVSETSARAFPTTRHARLAGHANTRIEPWLVYSPKNRMAVVKSANIFFMQNARRLALEKALRS
jgi:hypothetical protein